MCRKATSCMSHHCYNLQQVYGWRWSHGPEESVIRDRSKVKNQVLLENFFGFFWHCCEQQSLHLCSNQWTETLRIQVDNTATISTGLIGRYSNRQSNAPSAAVRSASRCLLAALKPKLSLIRKYKRKRCAECAKHEIGNRTDSFCETCSVHLCYTKTRNCFADYHSLNRLSND